MQTFSCRCFSLVLALAICLTARPLLACPFCAATSPTIGEEIAPAEVVVLARLAGFGPVDKRATEVSAKRSVVARYEILDVLRGGSALRGARVVEITDATERKIGEIRILTGCGAPQLTWSELHRLTQRSRAYVRTLATLPAEGPERLEFFHGYLEDAEELIAQDAYNEFANAPYSAVRELKGQMDRRHLAAKIADAKTPANRRGLLFTMLGICGTPDDLPLLEDYLRRGSRANPGSFDAILAAWLSLDGEAGLNLVDKLFLQAEPDVKREPEQAEAHLANGHAAIRALRFHLEEQHGVSKERILKSLRLLLERPELASVVISDLARWQDWQALPRLVKLFKESESSGLRVQVVNYLLVCPLPEAARQLELLERIAPKDVEQARILGVYRKGSPASPQPPGVPEPE